MEPNLTQYGYIWTYIWTYKMLQSFGLKSIILCMVGNSSISSIKGLGQSLSVELIFIALKFIGWLLHVNNLWSEEEEDGFSRRMILTSEIFVSDRTKIGINCRLFFKHRGKWRAYYPEKFGRAFLSRQRGWRLQASLNGCMRWLLDGEMGGGGSSR